MDMSFDVGKVFQERLASSMGLDKYRYIMEQVSITNVAVDTDFQRTFNGFYIVRRNESWRKSYYEYFESVKNGKPTFENIITYLYESTGNIEPSFSSKMLATILPEKPIWDRYVVQNLNMQLTGATKEEKLKNAILLYADMEKWYADFLETEKGQECISEFDRVLPDYKGISSIKKIDSIDAYTQGHAGACIESCRTCLVSIFSKYKGTEAFAKWMRGIYNTSGENTTSTAQDLSQALNTELRKDDLADFFYENRAGKLTKTKTIYMIYSMMSDYGTHRNEATQENPTLEDALFSLRLMDSILFWVYSKKK